MPLIILASIVLAVLAVAGISTGKADPVVIVPPGNEVVLPGSVPTDWGVFLGGIIVIVVIIYTTRSKYANHSHRDDVHNPADRLL